MFKKIFGVSYVEAKAKVRYRILILTLLPVLLTLVCLVFITIYWNISYTGTQLFMKVKADLTVAQKMLEIEQREQLTALNSLGNSYQFHQALAFTSSSNSGSSSDPQSAFDALLAEQQQALGLDFLRWLPPAQMQADPSLQPFRYHLDLGQGQSGLEVLSQAQLSLLSPELAAQANIELIATQKAVTPNKALLNQGLSQGLVSRSVQPIVDLEGKLLGYLDGGILLNHNTELVDTIRNAVYGAGTLPDSSVGAVTIFLGDVRISTNVPVDANPYSQHDFQRAIGTLVSAEVQEQVLVNGHRWVDRAFVYDDWFVSAYAPLHDIRGQRVGMIYSGFSESPFVYNYLLNILELGFILTLNLMISGWLVYRGAYSLLQPIERIHHVVKAVQSGKDVRIGQLGLARENELSHLAAQFDLMLDQLQQRNAQIQAAAEHLEMKVEQRTRSLQQKTKELEQNVKLLNETRQQLLINEKLTALGELTAGIAHEINNPTAVILGNMELLKYELGEHADRVAEEIELVLQQVSRISTIIRSLLQYSRPGEFNAPLQSQSITPIIEEMLVLVRHSIKKKEVVLKTELQAHSAVEINKPQLLQVLINLVINAAHASDNNGRIWVRSQDWFDPNNPEQLLGVQIQVEDEGAGIPPEIINRIFDPFYTTRNEGTGLGLSLSYGIIKRIGGLIEVDSTLGEGTTFTISLYQQSRGTDDGIYEGLQFSKALKHDRK